MKNPKRVAELLAELRTLTENDFERHRIDVLERDLTAPPVVEQVDNTHQRFDGIIFTKRKCGHYEKAFGIHQIIWAYYYGEIPNEHVIHHVDKNPANNNVQNLKCLSRGEHSLLHEGDAIFVRKCATCGKEFKTNSVGDIYCSATCKQNLQTYEKRCAFCGKIFVCSAKHRGKKFCSQECLLADRKKQHTEKLSTTNEVCRFCGKTFPSTNRIRGGFCSVECASKHHKLTNLEKRTCAFCHADFTAYKFSKAKYCSQSCAAKAREAAKRQSSKQS